MFLSYFYSHISNLRMFHKNELRNYKQITSSLHQLDGCYSFAYRLKQSFWPKSGAKVQHFFLRKKMTARVKMEKLPEPLKL